MSEEWVIFKILVIYISHGKLPTRLLGKKGPQATALGFGTMD